METGVSTLTGASAGQRNSVGDTNVAVTGLPSNGNSNTPNVNPTNVTTSNTTEELDEGSRPSGRKRFLGLPLPSSSASPASRDEDGLYPTSGGKKKTGPSSGKDTVESLREELIKRDKELNEKDRQLRAAQNALEDISEK